PSPGHADDGLHFPRILRDPHSPPGSARSRISTGLAGRGSQYAGSARSLRCGRFASRFAQAETTLMVAASGRAALPAPTYRTRPRSLSLALEYSFPPTHGLPVRSRPSSASRRSQRKNLLLVQWRIGPLRLSSYRPGPLEGGALAIQN